MLRIIQNVAVASSSLGGFWGSVWLGRCMHQLRFYKGQSLQTVFLSRQGAVENKTRQVGSCGLDVGNRRTWEWDGEEVGWMYAQELPGGLASKFPRTCHSQNGFVHLKVVPAFLHQDSSLSNMFLMLIPEQFTRGGNVERTSFLLEEATMADGLRDMTKEIYLTPRSPMQM